MRFGVAILPTLEARATMDLAAEAESLGYDSFFVPDQTFGRDPFGLIACCAQATRDIKLGMAVTNPYTRHPVQIARGAGFLAEASGGRFLLGLGAGNRSHLLHGLGIPQRHAVERLRETIIIVRQLLSGETVSYTSATLTLNGVALDFVLKSEVPILVASQNRRMLSLAGELADGAIISSLARKRGLDFAFSSIAEGAARVGRAASQLARISWQMLFLGEKRELASSAAVQRWAVAMIRDATSDFLQAAEIDRSGLANSLEDSALQEELPIAADDVAKLFTIGRPEEVVRQLEVVSAHGIDTYVALIVGTPEDVRCTMQRFAIDVMPALTESR